MDNIATDCVHHWILEEPNGVVGSGTCKKCHSTKSFRFYEPMENVYNLGPRYKIGTLRTFRS